MDIRELFSIAFGVSSPVYLTVPIGKTPKPEINYPSINIKEVDLKEAKRYSRLGTPIVFPLMFEGGDYKFYNSRAQIVEEKLSEFWFPPATMVDFSQAKNITKTDVIGNNGTVKEIFGFDDWQIRIRTLCITDELKAREYEKRIIEWSRVAGSIKVVGELFTDKNIFNLVIEDIDIKSIEGSPNVIPIELTCSSDEPFELIYRD